MSQAGVVDVIGTNPEIPTTFITDDGTAIPIANTLEVLGQKAGDVQAMETHGSGNTITIEDRTFITQYVVDPSSTVGLRGTFQTIQAAIDQAVLDGASNTNFKRIYLRGSEPYIENLTIPDGIFLTSDNIQRGATGGGGLSGAGGTINGNHTVAEDAEFACSFITFNSQSGSDLFTSPGFSISAFECGFFGGGSGNFANFTTLKGLCYFEGCKNDSNTFSFQGLVSLSIINCDFQASIFTCDFVLSVTIVDSSLARLSGDTSVAGYVKGCIFNNLGDGQPSIINYNSSNPIMDCNFFAPIAVSTQIPGSSVTFSNSSVDAASGILTSGRIWGSADVAGSILNTQAPPNTSIPVTRVDHYIGVQSTSVAKTVNLPQTNIQIGKEFIIADESGLASINNITVTTLAGTILIDGAPTYVINANFGTVRVMWTGTFYKIL